MARSKQSADFFKRVYETVRMIPYGKVTTYGIIAEYVGTPGAARMVGFALNKSYTQKEFVPAHRVVNRIGLLTGKNQFGAPDYMQKMLEKEGLSIRNDKIQNFEEHLWNPQSS